MLALRENICEPSYSTFDIDGIQSPKFDIFEHFQSKSTHKAGDE